MGKILRLTESELVKLIKKTINEAVRPELVVNDYESFSYQYPENGKVIPRQKREEWITRMIPIIEKSAKAIEYFDSGLGSRFGRPNEKMTKIKVGTSSTGLDEYNANLAKIRFQDLLSILKEAASRVYVDGYGKLDDTFIEQYILVSDQMYQRTSLNKNVYSSKGSKPVDTERDCYIQLYEFGVEGLEDLEIYQVSQGVKSGAGVSKIYSVLRGRKQVRPQIIRDQLKLLKNFTDIMSLDDFFGGKGGLQRFINSNISNVFSEKHRIYWIDSIVKVLNEKSNRSIGGRDIASREGDKIVIFY